MDVEGQARFADDSFGLIAFQVASVNAPRWMHLQPLLYENYRNLRYALPLPTYGAHKHRIINYEGEFGL